MLTMQDSRGLDRPLVEGGLRDGHAVLRCCRAPLGLTTWNLVADEKGGPVCQRKDEQETKIR